MIETLAQLKRYLKPGSRVDLTYHWRMPTTCGSRTVIKASMGKVTFEIDGTKLQSELDLNLAHRIGLRSGGFDVYVRHVDGPAMCYDYLDEDDKQGAAHPAPLRPNPRSGNGRAAKQEKPCVSRPVPWLRPMLAIPCG